MTTRRKGAERRKYKRYKSREGMLVEIKSYPFMVGQIFDIGAGGLSFLYLRGKSVLKKANVLNIWVNNELYMNGVAYQTVSEVQLSEYGDIESGGYKRIRHGVQFGILSEEQRSKLENFIRNYTFRPQLFYNIKRSLKQLFYIK